MVDNVTFLELATLKTIAEYWATYHHAPSRELLYPTLINAWLNREGAIEAGYANPLTATDKFNKAIRQLRRLGLLSASRFYTPSDTAPALFERLGEDWRTWPVVIPIVELNGQPFLDFEGATYVLD